MIAGVVVFPESTTANIDQKLHDHYIQKGIIDFSVVITPDFKEIENKQMSKRIVTLNHYDLPKLHSKLKKLLTYK